MLLGRSLAVVAGAAFLVVFTSMPLTVQAAGEMGSLAGSSQQEAAAPQGSRAAGEYEVGSAEDLAEAIEAIEGSGATEATIVLTADVDDNVQFAGIDGVHVTVRSEGDAAHLLDMKSVTSLAGGLTLDNVQVTARTIYACGHDFETTDAFDGSLAYFYGGGPEGMDVTGSPTITIRGGSISTFFGGGRDSNLDGSVRVLIDDPDFRAGGTWREMHTGDNTVGTLYGGGYAKETSKGCVKGDVTIEVRSGAFGGGYGGGYNDVPDAYQSDSDEARQPAAVSGTVTMKLGSKGAPAGCVWPGRAMYTHAGSWHSTVGNVRLEVLEGTSMDNDGGDRDIFGCGWRDTVRGTVEVTVCGAWMGSSFVYGGGDDSGDTRARNAGPVHVLNEQAAAKAVSITYATDAASNNELDGGVNAGSNESTPMEIHGDVEVTLESGNIAFLVLDNENFRDEVCSIAGDSHIQINGGRVAQVQGNKLEYQSDETEHRTTVSVAGGKPEAPVEIGYFYYFDEVEIGEGANVLVDATEFSQFSDATQKPFYSTDNLTVARNAVLTTRNNGQARILSQVYLAGTWNQEYVSGNAMPDDDARDDADLRIGNSLEIDGGTLVSHGTMHVYNDVACTGGTLALMQPTIFSMTGSGDREVSFDETYLYLPIVPTVNEGYPEAADEQIRLACGDALTGTVNVHLFDDASTWSTDAVVADAHVGTNYISANAALSDLEATLANAGAKEDGYFFKRVDDAGKTDAVGEDYDMWQIAIHNVTPEQPGGPEPEQPGGETLERPVQPAQPDGNVQKPTSGGDESGLPSTGDMLSAVAAATAITGAVFVVHGLRRSKRGA